MTRKLGVLIRSGVLSLFVAVLPARAADDPHAAPASGAEDLRTFVPGALALEGKILAPCCWNQTVDIHGSEVSNAIRREIRSRLRAGEPADAIQASLVDRYGTKILAMTADSPLKNVALGVLLAIAGVGAAGVFMLRRWRRAGELAGKKRSNGAARSDDASEARLDARLDAELRALDD